MSAAGVLPEAHEESVVVREAVAQARGPGVEEKQEKSDRDYLMVVVAIIVAFTFTVVVMGTMLITLALRGSGVMGSVSRCLARLIC